jgi:Domain of Unknown Function (DUF1080)
MRILTMATVIGAMSLASAAAQPPPPKQPAPAAPHQHDADQPIKGSGKMPDGWKVRFDDAAAKPEQVIVEEKDGTLTFTTGPAGIYYKPSMKAEKDYELTGSFSLLKPSEHPEAFGLFIAGQDLDKDTQRYTYFLVRQDGKFLIKSRNGAATKAIVDWADAPAMKEPKGVKTSNTLQIRATGDTVRFYINDKQVHKLTRAQAGGDGIAGARVNHNLNVQVGKLTLKKLE